jgi:hypothetical protein
MPAPKGYHLHERFSSSLCGLIVLVCRFTPALLTTNGACPQILPEVASLLKRKPECVGKQKGSGNVIDLLRIWTPFEQGAGKAHVTLSMTGA